MHDYNTIIGVIGLRNEKVSIPIIRKRYGIGCSGIQLILDRNLYILRKISGKRIFLCLILNATITA